MNELRMPDQSPDSLLAPLTDSQRLNSLECRASLLAAITADAVTRGEATRDELAALIAANQHDHQAMRTWILSAEARSEAIEQALEHQAQRTEDGARRLSLHSDRLDELKVVQDAQQEAAGRRWRKLSDVQSALEVTLHSLDDRMGELQGDLEFRLTSTHAQVDDLVDQVRALAVHLGDSSQEISHGIVTLDADLGRMELTLAELAEAGDAACRRGEEADRRLGDRLTRLDRVVAEIRGKQADMETNRDRLSEGLSTLAKQLTFQGQLFKSAMRQAEAEHESRLAEAERRHRVALEQVMAELAELKRRDALRSDEQRRLRAEIEKVQGEQSRLSSRIQSILHTLSRSFRPASWGA